MPRSDQVLSHYKTKPKALLAALAMCGVAVAQQQSAPIGELFASDGNAKLVQPAGAGMGVVAGSELSAGIAPARLRLYRGGQVRICQKSGMSVNSGQYGLMFGMSPGAAEFDYTLSQRGADLVLTPDFSLQLSGPGKYHFALGVTKQGDTCVKSLPGNGSPLQVSELLGTATYRVRAQDSIVFHGGRLTGNTMLKPEEACGCPEAPSALQANAQPAPETNPPAVQPQPGVQARPSPIPPQNATEPIPQDRPGQVHVQVDAPFVFSARDAGSIKPYSVARLSLPNLPNVFFVQETVDPVVLSEKPAVVSVREEAPPRASPAEPAKAPEPKKKEKKGFMGKLKGLFGGLFGR